MALDALPLTPNGKVDRAALPEPSFSEAADEAYVAPEGSTEQGIAEVWREILDVPRVGANTNFFDAGGHSLMMARVHARLAERLGVQLSIVDLFQYPTIRMLGSHLAATAAGPF